MSSKVFSLAGSFLVALALSFSAFAQHAENKDKPVTTAGRAITVAVEGKAPIKLDADLAKLKRVTIKASDHGTEATFEGISVADVLTLAGVELGEKLRGKRLAEFVVIEAADDYRAVYSIAEFDPSFTDKVIILADTRDGKTLPQANGTWQVIVPGEKRAGRWVRQVTSIKVLTAK